MNDDNYSGYPEIPFHCRAICFTGQLLDHEYPPAQIPARNLSFNGYKFIPAVVIGALVNPGASAAPMRCSCPDRGQFRQSLLVALQTVVDHVSLILEQLDHAYDCSHSHSRE